MVGAFGDVFTFLLNVVISLFTYAVLLRFLLQVMRADFYNPLSQTIVRITDPVLRPVRMIVRPVGGIDSASLLLALLLQILLLFVIYGSQMTPVLAVMGASFRLPLILLGLYQFLLIVMVILSWVAPGSPHPAATLAWQLTEPVLQPLRRVIPPMGGLDLSVLVAFLIIISVKDILLLALAKELGLAFVYTIR